MGTVIDENSPQIDPESEVRKLQEMVKRLEHQNLVLRTNQSDIGGLKENNENNIIKTTPRKESYINDTIVKSKDTKYNRSLSEVDVIDVDVIKEEEDSWLYTSPNSASEKKQPNSPLDWMRQDLEEASPEIASVRRSLVFKLNEVARVIRSPSSGALSSSSSLLSPSPVSGTPLPSKAHISKYASPTTYNTEVVSDSYSSTLPVSNSVGSCEDSIPKIRRPFRGLDEDIVANSSRVNTNTFRKKKNPYIESTSVDISPAEDVRSELVSPASHSEFSAQDDPVNQSSPSPRPTPDRDTNGNGSLSRNSSVDNSSDSPRGSDYKLTDVVDVQVLARMQEESLRQSMNSPKISRKTMSSARGANSENTGYGSTRSSPGRYLENDGYGNMARSNASLGSLSSNSDSPASSPYSSQYLDSNHHQTDGHRRSMPNLAKTMPLSLRTVPSDPELLDEEHNASYNHRNVRRTAQPLQGRTLASPNRYGASSAGRYQGTSSPANRRGSAPLQPQHYSSQNSHIDSSPQRSLPRTMARQQTYTNNNNSRYGGTRSTGLQGQSPTKQRTYSKSPARTLSPQRGGGGSVSNNNFDDSRNKSPQRSGLPTPRSSLGTGIPRPGGSVSKLPGPRKSSIPASRRAALFRGENEDSWKDGCY